MYECKKVKPYNHDVWKVRDKLQAQTTKNANAPTNFFSKRGKSVFVGESSKPKKTVQQQQHQQSNNLQLNTLSDKRGSTLSSQPLTPMAMNIQLPDIN